MHPVGQRLEVDGGGRDLLPGRVVAVCQVATAGQVQTHHAGMWRQQRRVDSKVRRAPGVGLHVHAPGLLIQVEGLQGPLLAQVLHLVDDLVAAVVAGSWLTLRVLVGQRGTQALHDCPRGEVLRGNQLNAPRLPSLLLLHQVVHHRVHLCQGLVAGQCRPVGNLGTGGDALGGHHELGVCLTRSAS